MTLSERRALAVKNYILKNFPGMQAQPLPDDRPRREQPGRAQHDRGGRQLNRRTDIKVVLATEG